VLLSRFCAFQLTLLWERVCGGSVQSLRMNYRALRLAWFYAKISL
jgi:hypothetical protein